MDNFTMIHHLLNIKNKKLCNEEKQALEKAIHILKQGIKTGADSTSEEWEFPFVK